MDDKAKKLYIDMATWVDAVKVDDFLVAIGKNKSNSVYHVASVRQGSTRGRIIRYHLEVFKIELIVALKREPEQRLITIYWYSRKKRK